ncbi:hypothetical protein [Xylanibacter muris]|uniref:Uncharacterized protein n=2 Tax=Xylanibacter muris TaxID=2736290 RepID=A0ABX2ANM5_9BACT|nr:hypothetical protein [Xylanibacter muris]NPD92836.1 hypothetical protein [Xylanibacter muris]
MKKSIYFLLFIAALILCNSHAMCNNTIDKEKSSVISGEYIDIINKADSIVWYLLDPMPEDTTILNNDKNWEILICSTDTLEERCNALKSTLTYPQSFVKNNMVKESAFLPDIAVCFYSKSDVVTFSYSFYCDVCRFKRDGKYQDADGELIRKAVIQMACENFPKDRYLRNLKRKEK